MDPYAGLPRECASVSGTATSACCGVTRISSRSDRGSDTYIELDATDQEESE